MGNLTRSQVGWYKQNVEPEEKDGDIFKQISSLLGIKIVNVFIADNKITLFGKRNRRKFIVEIESSLVVVKDDKGETISEMTLNPIAKFKW